MEIKSALYLTIGTVVPAYVMSVFTECFCETHIKRVNINTSTNVLYPYNTNFIPPVNVSGKTMKVTSKNLAYVYLIHFEELNPTGCNTAEIRSTIINRTL